MSCVSGQNKGRITASARRGDGQGQGRSRDNNANTSGGAKKTVTFDEKFVRTEKSPSSALVGGKRRRGYRSYGEDDSDKENSHRGNRGQHHHHYHHQHHHHSNHRDLWDDPSPGVAGAGGGRVRMKSPRVSGASSWAGGEPKFVVPRMKSHVSPSAVKMKMRSEDLTSPLWAELVFSSDDEFDKVTSPSDNNSPFVIQAV